MKDRLTDKGQTNRDKIRDSNESLDIYDHLLLYHHVSKNPKPGASFKNSAYWASNVYFTEKRHSFIQKKDVQTQHLSCQGKGCTDLVSKLLR